MSLAIIILTFNEEKNIVDVISSARKLTDEIIVIDSGSIDNTVNLAEKNGAKVLHRPWDNDFAAQRNFGDHNTEASYILHLDADERISDKLASEIKKIDQNPTKIYGFRRSNILFGQRFYHGVFRPDLVKRLYPRNMALWEGKVHESLKSQLPVYYLSGMIEHYPYDSWEQHFRKFSSYTTIWASQASAKGKKTSITKAILHSGGSLVKVMVIHKGILDGYLGIITCFIHSLYTLTKYLKLFLINRRNRIVNIN